MSKVLVGVNGFGRFGLHFLKYWLDRKETCEFEVGYINDEVLSLNKALEIINTDKFVDFRKYQINKSDDMLTFISKEGVVSKIKYTQKQKEQMPWVGEVKLFLECSGRYSMKEDASYFLKGQTEHVLISQTSWDCDKTLVYGLNHEEFTSSDKLISYGSCTVNAFSGITNFLNKKYGIKNTDVNVIHNIPPYKLEDPKNNTLVRRFCTLEKSGPTLLPFLNENNFNINYTLIPYDGVSIFDYRFELEAGATREDIVATLETAFTSGELKGLYAFEEEDRGPEVHSCSPYSAVLIKDNVKVRGNHLYLHSYFDNENSVNRYFDLVNFVSNKVN